MNSQAIATKVKAKPNRGGKIDPTDGKPNWPWPDGGELPDDLLSGVIARLDAELPLLLLPVRIETHYKLDATPPELRIRIYPDQVQINNDRPEASPAEVAQAKEFWIGWYKANNDGGRNGAWQRYARQVGVKRAGYLARMLRPKQSKTGKLTFPTVPGKTSTGSACQTGVHAHAMAGDWL